MLPAEEQQLLEATPLAPSFTPVHEQIAAMARRQPDALAVSSTAEAAPTATLSYRELDQRATQLAAHLQTAGVGPEQLVGISMTRSPELIVALLAILKAGGAYLPLDAAYPDQRLSQMLTQARPHWMLVDVHTQARMADLVQQHALGTQLMAVHDIASHEPGWPDANAAPTPPHRPTQGGQLAYVIFTSGSTGQPKGVMIEHRNLSAYVSAAVQAYGLVAQDRVLQFASISFDAAVEEIFAPLAVGATVVLRHEEMLASPRHFMAACVQHRLTVLPLPTAYWRVLATASDEELLQPLQAAQPGTLDVAPPWRLAVIGGEAASPAALQRWQARFGQHARLINSYGPTETTVVATVAEVPASYKASVAHAATHEAVSIGRPLAGTTIRILDAQQRPVPIGVTGEIHIGGAQVGRGYLGQPELTATRFIADPGHPAQTGQRLYRTGDLGRWTARGDIEHLGRNDDQVKLRGFRIELGEIDARLVQAPGVRDAVVALRPASDGPGDDQRGAQLVAYVVPHAPQIDPAQMRRELRTQLAACLPDYMQPHALVLMPALPLSPNGKVDRRALPAPGIEALTSHAFEAPINEREQILAGIWA